MLLHGFLKCFILYLLFDFCATVKQRRTSNIDKRIRSLRRSLEVSESDKLDVNVKDSQNENDENKKQQSGPEADESSKEKKGQESDETPEIKEYSAVTQPYIFNISDHSADKVLEMNKLSSMTGFDYSPAEVEKFKIWSQGIIPFYIDEFSYDKIIRDKLREILDEASSLTGLRFMEVPRPPTDGNTRWVFIINRRAQLECTDYTAKSFTNTGVQKLVIGYDCISPQFIAPIVLALAGVPPQHNSPDRDKYIDVSTKSIQPDKIDLFTAVKPEDWLFHDLKYDFSSAGHYPTHKYTVDGTATIVPKSKIETFIGETDGLSYTDVAKIRMLYNFVLEKDDKNAKLPDCKALYRPGPNFKMTEVLDHHTVPARKKPKEYIEAAKQAGIEIVEGFEGHRVADDKITDKENSDDSGEDNDKSKNSTEEKTDSLNENNISSEKELEHAEREKMRKIKPTSSTADPMTIPDNITSDE